MAILESRKQSDLEKRLKILRQQVHGKKSDELGKYTLSPKSSESFQSDITYLRQDLFKILIFSSVAIGLQIVLFILSKNHILNLFFS